MVAVRPSCSRRCIALYALSPPVDAPVTSAALNSPSGIAFDEAANRYIATIAGTGQAGFSGEATLDSPQGLAVDSAGAIYFVNQRNFRVRKLTPSRIVAECVTNGATLTVGPFFPGQIVSIFGFDLGPASGAGLAFDSCARVSTQLAGTQVLFDGIAAPPLYVSSGRVDTVVPYSVAASTRLQVVYQGRPTNTVTLPVAPSSPGLFAIANQDGSVNTASNPAAPAGVGASVATSVFPKPLLAVTVQIGGRPANVLCAGAAPGFVAGVLQINIAIPAGLGGSLPLQVKFGDAAKFAVYPASPASTPRIYAKLLAIPGTGLSALISYSRFT